MYVLNTGEEEKNTHSAKFTWPAIDHSPKSQIKAYIDAFCRQLMQPILPYN